jgi:hypothetical protein
MPAFEGREHFIPLRRQELIDWLCADESLLADEQESFRLLCRWLAGSLHFRFNQRFEELKTAYDPFDPDTDMQPLMRLKAEEKQKRLNALYRDFGWLMDRANFVHLTCNDIEAGLKETSAWGVPMRVDFSAFEHLAIFARGDVLLPRTRRRWRNWYRKEETKASSYQRLVMILKLRPNHSYGEGVNTDCVYLKIFKDIPKLDIKMLLPTARVKFTNLDRGRIGFPLVSGIAAALYKLGSEALQWLTQLWGALDNPFLLWGIAAGGVTYSYRSYYGYQQMKQRYHLALTKSLYYQNLDSNAGVLYRLFDEAEEQECKEAILAYFLLWKHAGPGGWTALDLDQFVEPFLESRAHVPVDFETAHALATLDKFGLIEKSGEQCRARPIGEALTRLEAAWGNYLHMERSPPSRSVRAVPAAR